MTEIRPAHADDLAAVRRIFREASLWNEGDRAALLAHPEYLVLAEGGLVEGRMRVAVDACGAVVGFATLRPVAGAWELEDLFVDPVHMRRGIATALVTHLLDEADIDDIVVTANPHAMAFYRSVGFVDDGVDETRFGPAPRMRLTIGALGPSAP
jgi:GNAT superfamily N-acetyltransferase